MKIAFLARSLGAGGTERQLVNLASGLRARGHEVNVITFYSGGAFESEMLSADVEVLPLRKSGRWHVLRFARSLRRGRDCGELRQ